MVRFIVSPILLPWILAPIISGVVDARDGWPDIPYDYCYEAAAGEGAYADTFNALGNLDGDWRRSDESDQWDGSTPAPADGAPGGVDIEIVPAGAGNEEASVLTIEDVGDPGAAFPDPNNRRISLWRDTSGELDLATGVTLVARWRLHPSPRSVEFENNGGELPVPNGTTLHTTNRGQIGFVQKTAVEGTLTATLALAITDGGDLQFAQGFDGSQCVGSSQEICFAIDEDDWVTVWMAARQDEGNPDAIRVKLFLDGESDPALDTVLPGVPTSAEPALLPETGGVAASYLGIALGSDIQDGAIQVDYLCATTGFHEPADFLPASGEFVRSDANDDGGTDLSDAIYTLAWLFLGGPPPVCLDAADANDSAEIDLSDAVYTLSFLFTGGLPPVAPFPACGGDPTTANDPLDCASFTRCSPIPETTVDVRSEILCYLAGETAEITVDTPPLAEGSLHVLVFEEAHEGGGEILLDTMRPLDGSTAYEFSVELPAEVMYNAVARLLDSTGQEIARDGLEVGVRPDFPEIPAELCTFEIASIDSTVLHDQVEQAVFLDETLALDMAGRSFEVRLEDVTDRLLSDEVREQNPAILLYRGSVVDDPGSRVCVSFFGDFPGEFVDACVEPSGDEAALYFEPAVEHDPGLPPDLYVCYESSHVRIPLEEHAVPHEGEAGAAAEKNPPDGAGADHDRGCRRLRMNLYYDSNSTGSRFSHLNRIGSTFSNELAIDIVVVSDTQIDTNGYSDPGATNSSFVNDPNTTVDGVDIAMLFTRNSSHIDYGTTLGQGRSLRADYTNQPYCWVYRKGSNKRIRVIGCQEISHVLGASDTSSGHRNSRYRYHIHGSGIFAWPHSHYSIMRGTYKGDDASDLKWFHSDARDIRSVVTNELGHFPRALRLNVVGTGTVNTRPPLADLHCDIDAVVRLTPTPAEGWRFDGFSGPADCDDWEVASPAPELKDACTAHFTQVFGGAPIPASLWFNDDTSAMEAPRLSFSPDSTQIVRTTPGHELKILNSTSGSTVRTFSGHTQEILDVAWSPDGTWIASGAADSKLLVYRALGSSQFPRVNHTDSVTSVAWNPDGSLLASGSLDGTIRIWNVPGGVFLANTITVEDGGPPIAVEAVAWSSDGTEILALTPGSATHGSLLWRFIAETGQHNFWYVGCNSTVTAMAWSPSRRVLARGCVTGAASLLNSGPQPVQELSLAGMNTTVLDIAWSADATQLVTISADDRLRWWNALDGQFIMDLPFFFPTDIRHVAWSPNSRYLAVSGDQGSIVIMLELYR